MIRTVKSIYSRRADEHPLTPRTVAITSALYCPAGLAIGAVDHTFLLMAWVMAGFLGLSIYLTLDRRMPIANPGTVFFSGAVLSCIAGFALGVG